MVRKLSTMGAAGVAGLERVSTAAAQALRPVPGSSCIAPTVEGYEGTGDGSQWDMIDHCRRTGTGAVDNCKSKCKESYDPQDGDTCQDEGVVEWAALEDALITMGLDAENEKL